MRIFAGDVDKARRVDKLIESVAVRGTRKSLGRHIDLSLRGCLRFPLVSLVTATVINKLTSTNAHFNNYFCTYRAFLCVSLEFPLCDAGNGATVFVEKSLMWGPSMLDEKAEERRRQLLEMMEHLYGPDGRREFARDLKVSHSLIATILRGERPMSEKFLVGMMNQMEELLEFKALQLYEARSIAIEIGRGVVPTYDLPFIVSNEEKARETELFRASAAEGEEPDPAILEEIRSIIESERKA